MARWRAALRFLGSFGLARGGLFVAPILLANLLAPVDYGRLEFAQAVASVAAPVLSLGTASAVPLALVTRAAGVSWAAILFHHAAVGALALLALLAAWVAGASGAIMLALLCLAVLLWQALWSVVLRSQGRGEASLLLDAGFWVLLALAAALAMVAGVEPASRADWVLGTLALYGAGLAMAVVLGLSRADTGLARGNYVSTLRAGLSLMAVTVLAMLAVSLGRIGVGFYSTPEVTADYGALFRATAVPIVAHQIVVVARFRQVFEWPIERVQRTLPWIVGCVAACVLAFWLFSPFASLLFGPAFARAFEQHRAVGLLVLTQCILWSAIALNDLVNTRMQTAAAVARASAGYFVLALPLAAAALDPGAADLLTLVAIHSCLMFGYYAVQSLVMWRGGIALTHTWLMAGVSFLGLSLLALVA